MMGWNKIVIIITRKTIAVVKNVSSIIKLNIDLSKL